MGCRYYDKENIAPQFPFGHGLSYTTFEYANLNVERSADKKYPVTASVDVTNTGNVIGKEVVQQC